MPANLRETLETFEEDAGSLATAKAGEFVTVQEGMKLICIENYIFELHNYIKENFPDYMYT